MAEGLPLFMPKLRKVGNPVALLNHVADYTTRELDLRNEIKGADELRIKEEVSDEFPMGTTSIPEILPRIVQQGRACLGIREGDSLEDGIEAGSLSWATLLSLFRIHGAYLFGIGTFHGDLHPGNCIIDEEGKFVFIDNGAICHAPKHVNKSLFTFFRYLSDHDFEKAFRALLDISEKQLPHKDAVEYMSQMAIIYHDFEMKTVGEQSLTQIMMKTVRCAVEKPEQSLGRRPSRSLWP